MKSIVVVGCVVGGAVAGYRIALWWLDRTVQSPELESAIYPGTGTIAGAFVGLAFGLFVAFLIRPPRRDSGSSGEDEADERGPPEPGSQRRS